MRLASIMDIAAAVRGRRQALGLSQSQVAARAGVSRRWLNGFEAGGSLHAEAGAILRVLEALDLELHANPRGSDQSARRDTDPDAVDLDTLLDDLRRG
jgi:transcriptional regulator with XRE-family HTH domain